MNNETMIEGMEHSLTTMKAAFSHLKTVMTSSQDHQIKHLFSVENNDFKAAVMSLIGK